MGPYRPRGGNPKALGDVLGKFLRSSGLKEKLRSPKIYDCWPEVAGAEACSHSRVVGFTNCVLHIEVDSAPWLQMLATFRKKELLQNLRERLIGVRVVDIKFKIGAGPAPDERNPWPTKPPIPSSSNPPRPHTTPAT